MEISIVVIPYLFSNRLSVLIILFGFHKAICPISNALSVFFAVKIVFLLADVVFPQTEPLSISSVLLIALVDIGRVSEQAVSVQLVSGRPAKFIIRYFPAEEGNLSYSLIGVMSDLWHTEQDFADHCAIEDEILRPALHTERAKRKRMSIPETEELSEREKEVLVQVVKGLSNKEIADALFISLHTVISHRKNIARKLNIHSTAGLTIYTIVNKLIDIDHL